MRRLPRSLIHRAAAVIVVATLAAPGGASSYVSAQAPLPDVLQFTIAAADAVGLIREASGIAEAPDGTVYVVDGAANRVQRFAPDGTVTDVWGDLGTAEGLFDAPTGIAVAGDGSIYVADTGNDRVQRFDAGGQFLGQLGGPPGSPDALAGPLVVAVAVDGTVYVSNPGQGRVMRFGPDGAFLGAFGNEGPTDDRLDEPRDVAVGPDGTVYVLDYRRDRIVRFASEGTRLAHFRALDSEWPEREDLWLSTLAVGDDGMVYANRGAYGGIVYRFSPDGTERGKVSLRDGAGIVALAAPGTGRLLVGIQRRTTVDPTSRRRLVDPLVVLEIAAPDRTDGVFVEVASALRLFGTRSQGDAPGQFEARTSYFSPFHSLAVAPDGTLFVADYAQRRVQWFRRDGLWLGERRRLAEGPGPQVYGFGIAAAQDGSAWLADPVRGTLVHLGRDGSELGVLPAWLTLPSGAVASPSGVAVDPDGSLIVADAQFGGMARLSTTGEVLAEWGTASESVEGRYLGCLDWDVTIVSCTAQPVDVSPSGDVVYRLDGTNGRVQRYQRDGTVLASWAGLAASNWIGSTAQGVAVAPDGVVVASDTANRRVVRFGADGAINAVLDGTRTARGLRAAFDPPGGLDMAPDGTLYVADREGGRVLAFGSAATDAWRAEYFGNPWLAERPLAILHTAEIDLDWGEAAPDPALPADGWSARFERTYRLAGGDYLFIGQGEGGVRAWVGDQLVVDAWNAAPGPWRRSYPFVLSAEGDMAVRLEFKDAGGAASLAWSLAHGPTSTSTASPSPTGRIPSTPTSTSTPTGVAPHVDTLFVPYAGR